jgi:ketosteroid isomerase-like protein
MDSGSVKASFRLRQRSSPAKVGGFRGLFMPPRAGDWSGPASEPRRPPAAWAHRRDTGTSGTGRGTLRQIPPPPSRAGGNRTDFLPSRPLILRGLSGSIARPPKYTSPGGVVGAPSSGIVLRYFGFLCGDPPGALWVRSWLSRTLPLGDTGRAMSQENVELVRRATDAYNRGDLDGFLQDWASDAVLDWSNSRGVDAGVLRGHDEIRGFAERFLAAWDEVRIDLLNDPEEVKDGLLIAENVTYLRGRDGVEVEARSAWLVTIRQGQQTSLTLYQTKQEALEAVGLRE